MKTDYRHSSAAGLVSAMIMAASAAPWAIWSANTLLADEASSTGKADDVAPAVLTISGIVKDGFVGRPLEGATVTVYENVEPRPGNPTLVKRLETATDADGWYSFSWRTDDPDHRARQLGLPGEVLGWEFSIEAKHAGYLPDRDWSMVRLAESPRFDSQDGFAVRTESDDPAQRRLTAIELRPGKSVTGIVQGPDSKPVPGVRVVADSQPPRFERDQFARIPNNPVATNAHDECVTDAAGHFALAAITPGEAIVFVRPDKDLAPTKKYLYDQRGDVGVIRLDRGAVIHGKLLDVDGQPKAAVQVSAVPWNADGPAPSIRESRRSSIDEESHAAALTDTDGNFTLGRLPAGEYRVEPVQYFAGRKVNADGMYYNDVREVPGIFVPQKVKLSDGQDPPAIELRGVPTVAIEGRINYSPVPPNNPAGARGGFFAGNNIRTFFNVGNNPTVQGVFAGMPYRATIKVLDDEGGFKVVVPKGLAETAISIPTGAVGGRNMQAQWRLGQDGPLQTASKIRLGTLDKDFRDLEFLYSPMAITQEQLNQLGGQAFGAPPVQQPVAAGGRGGGRGAAAAGRAAPTARAGRGGGRGAAAQQPAQQQPADGDEDAGK